MAQLLGFTPSTYKSQTAEFTLGGLYTDASTGYIYRYVKAADSVAWVSGMVAEAAVTSTTTATAAFTATVDRAGGSSGNRIPIGVVVSALTAGEAGNATPYYVFVLVDGYHSAVREAGLAITKGSKFTTAASPADGDAAAVAAYTDHVVGIALAANTTGTFPAKIKVGY
jgi:hypothetical protein